MKLHRLRVQSFAAIRELDIAFGPGLNVLYGPNEIGKSTLAEAIRLALLLPYNSNHHEIYVPWSGADSPRIDLVFETGEQRIWRVQKHFGKRGNALLQESRNGKDFEDVERARGVDAKLREILRWGIPEPGGPGAPKGLPASFLATALLSTQAAVSDVLKTSLSGDPTGSGKERIAEGLEAVAQDPLFAELLREAQARRDEAYTDKGAKSRAQGSVFKIAADRVKETREEKERLEKMVEESDAIERRLRELDGERARRDEERADAEERLAKAVLLARQALNREEAAKNVEAARAEVLRIQSLDQRIAEAEEKVRQLAAHKERAALTLRDAQAEEAAAAEALDRAEEAARSAGLDSEMADTVARQDLELRRVAAEQALQAARQRAEAAVQARELSEAAERAAEEHRLQEAEAGRTRERRAEAVQAEQAASEALRRYDLLEHGLDYRNAEQRLAKAQVDVEKEAGHQSQLKKVSEERSALAEQRAAIPLPPADTLRDLRKLETELASARGALDVGLVVTVIPTAIVNLRVRKDGGESEPETIAQPVEIEADTEVEVDVADLATVRVRGGRREAQERVRALESRWENEALPHLAAAGAADLEELETKMSEAREQDSRLQSLDRDLDSLRRQIADLAGAAEAMRDASERLTTCRQELGDVAIETLAADLDALGPDPGTALRLRRQQASREADTARTEAQAAATAQALAEERAGRSREALASAEAARDAALSRFPDGVAAEASAAEAALRAAQDEQEKVAAELSSLQARIDAAKKRFEETLAAAREVTERSRRAVEAAREGLTQAGNNHASEEGRLTELRKLRDAEDLRVAERALQEATERHDALPVPERWVTEDEVERARGALETVKQSLTILDQEIHTTQGRLQQVGGAVARGRLREASEAFELAELQHWEVEMDYEGWKLLLETMKEADAAQASNLGRALAPAIETRFQSLTAQRYKTVHLTSHLELEGIVAAGAVRSPDRISIGTREQLSTLYRLCLGEYLRTTVVLDDQLVQSDHDRMDWFRALLLEKARSFQIVVFTCRPDDYLMPEAMVAQEGTVYRDSEEGFVRAVDLERAGKG